MIPTMIGRDATVYTLTGGGFDGTGAFNPGSPLNVLGRWKTITITFKTEWEETTPSSQRLKERRAITDDWSAVLENQVREDRGSDAMGFWLNNDYLQVVYVDGAGHTQTLIGGIEEGTLKMDEKTAMDTLNLINVGLSQILYV